MKIYVISVELDIIDNGFAFEYKFFEIPAISITATAPDGDKQQCFWRYRENDGVYKLDDRHYEPSNAGHQTFLNWLYKHTGCNEEEAIESMEEIIENIYTGPRYTNDGLLEACFNDNSEAIIESNLIKNCDHAFVCETEDCDYIGAVYFEDELKIMTIMTYEAVHQLFDKIKILKHDDDERTSLIIKAIEKSAGVFPIFRSY